MAATVSVDYNYPFASSLFSAPKSSQGPLLGPLPGSLLAYKPASQSVHESISNRQLRLATSGGAEKNPHFFSGRLINPKETADLLLALSLISRTRFFSPGELRERLLAAADPVVTSDGKRLRFEVFSVCCGAYARLDLNENALDGEWIGKGTTNIDFNSPMRAALATVISSEDVAMTIGVDRLELEQANKCIIERKVQLPVRWLKGFVEVQVYQSALKQAMELTALELTKAIRGLPQQNIMQAGTISYLVPVGKGLRLSQRDAPGAVAVGAVSRLKILEPILRYAKTVRIYSSDDAISAFQLTLSQGSFFFVLSPNAARGFSGEGQALKGLAQRSSTEVLARVKSLLVWQDRLNWQELSAALGVDNDAVLGALQVLGTRGLVGYDLSSGCFFHRELPFDLTLVEELHPRMKKARELLAENDVRLNRGDNGDTEAYVKGKSGDHFIQITADGARCTCEWFAKNQGDRGPCSHILAAELAMQEGDEIR